MQSKSHQAEIQRIAASIARAETSGDIETQLSLYKKLAELSPRSAVVQAQIAHLLFVQNDIEQASTYADRALAMPADTTVDSLLFQHLGEIPAYTAQLDLAKRLFEAQPNLWRFKLLYEALVAAKEDDQLEPLLLRMLGTSLTANEQSQLLTLLGQAYYSGARYHDAIGCYRAALELSPDNQTQMFNLGAALEQVGRYADAVELYKAVLEINPQHAGVHNNLAIVMLRLGEYAQGWKHYEWRWRSSLREQEQLFSIPRWEGEPLDGKTLLVWGEQGIGDHIMFSTMLSDLLARGGTLLYEIYARLDPLFERSFAPLTFLRRESAGEADQNGVTMFKQTWPKADYQIPMGSLAAILRQDLVSFGDGAAFLQPDVQLVDGLKAKYQAQFPDKHLIGISWRGGKAMHTERQSRKVSFPDLARLSAMKNVQFIDLQYDSTPEDRAALRKLGLDLYHDDDVDPTGMMDLPAAQLCALDAIISVDNSTVHLAGALGVPTYALIQLNPNWRWGLQEGKSIWYSSVHVIRNKTLTDWKEPLERVMSALEQDGII